MLGVFPVRKNQLISKLSAFVSFFAPKRTTCLTDYSIIFSFVVLIKRYQTLLLVSIIFEIILIVFLFIHRAGSWSIRALRLQASGPLPSSPLLSLPFPPFSFALLSLSFLRSRLPLIQLEGLGERCKLPQRGPG